MLDDDCAIAKLLLELNAQFVALIGGLTNVPADAVRHRDQKQKKAKFAKGDEVDVAMGDKRVAGHIAAQMGPSPSRSTATDATAETPARCRRTVRGGGGGGVRAATGRMVARRGTG